MKQSNGSRAEGELQSRLQGLFEAKTTLQKTAPMAGFARHESATAKRLAEIEGRVQSWDWRKEVASGGGAQPAGASEKRRPSPPKPSRQRPPVWALIAAGVIVLGAVLGIVLGTTGSNPPKPVGPGHSAAAIELKSADKSASVASLQLATGFADLKGLPTITAVTQFTDPYASALSSYVVRFDRIKWSPSELTASRALKSQVLVFISFLHSIHTITPDGLGAWIKDLYTHVAAVTGASQQLSHEVGLPLTVSV